MGKEIGRREMGVYLVGITGIGGAIIAILYTVFAAELPRFTASFVAEPVSTVQGDPGSTILILASILLIGLLIAFIVVFGAKYGPDPEQRERRTNRNQ